jgi:molybdopterin biosynthesis enzyme
LLKIKGEYPVFFPVAAARLSESVKGKNGWTDFVHARLEYRQNQLWVYPARLKSSLQSMAKKEALIIIPEDREKIVAGETVDVQLLTSSALSHLAAPPIT